MTQKFSDVQARTLAGIAQDLGVGSLRNKFAALAASNPRAYRARLAEFSESLRACEGGNEFKLLFRLAYYAAGPGFLDLDPLGVTAPMETMERVHRRLLENALDSPRVNNMHPEKSEAIGLAQDAIVREMQRSKCWPLLEELAMIAAHARNCRVYAIECIHGMPEDSIGTAAVRIGKMLQGIQVPGDRDEQIIEALIAAGELRPRESDEGEQRESRRS